ncbi:MAG: 4-(cytidine 5'-diphospho)-2-C-methyl-D-erythritol kinase, partial [Sulfitobacter sp.]|nr:4-(cytidine 5'-diphospho)-2-C-methyl-D-erythritol kinase [Sulfitobacter sp.]
MTSEGFAPAKVNLTLHVTGQRADGYHLLDSLVVFADIGDRLWFDAGPQMRISVTGPFAEGVPVDQRNLVWQAAVLAGWTGHITLEKNLPHGAGIGGGSSDAAAVLRAFGGTADALQLGADVPVCLAHAPQRMRGIGEILDPIAPLPDLEIVLVNPRVAVPTAPVFNG